MLESIKDQTRTEKQGGLVYSMKCGGYDKVYIGETAWTLAERTKNTQMANIPTLLSQNTLPSQATRHLG